MKAHYLLTLFIISTMWLTGVSSTYSLQAKTAVTKQGAILPAVAPPVTALVCAPNSGVVAVGAYRQVQLWNVERGAKRACWQGCRRMSVRWRFRRMAAFWRRAGAFPPFAAKSAFMMWRRECKLRFWPDTPTWYRAGVYAGWQTTCDGKRRQDPAYLELGGWA